MCHPEVPAGLAEPRVGTEEVEIAIGDERMPALLAVPELSTTAAVLVINDVFGRSPFYEHLARRLATAGYVALGPEFFFREGALPEQTREAAMARRARYDEERGLRDLGAAIDWLASRAEARGKIGTIGFCMGGTFALDLAALRNDVAATVSYYGFPASPQRERAAPRPLDLAGRMRGPILGHWGDEDDGVGMANVDELRRRLSGAGVEHEFHIYPGLGHGFLKAFLDEESSPGYEPACESWRRTLDFYRRHLAG